MHSSAQLSFFNEELVFTQNVILLLVSEVSNSVIVEFKVISSSWHPLVLSLKHDLTVASPDLSQVAATLARLFTELDDIPARRLRGDGYLSHSLFPIAEVHRQYHLKEGKNKKKRQEETEGRGWRFDGHSDREGKIKIMKEKHKKREKVIVCRCALKTKLSPLLRRTKPSVLTLHFTAHQPRLLVWAAPGLMPVPASFLLSMIRACQSVEDIQFRLGGEA